MIILMMIVKAYWRNPKSNYRRKKRIQIKANEKIKQLEANKNLVEEEKIKLMEE